MSKRIVVVTIACAVLVPLASGPTVFAAQRAVERPPAQVTRHTYDRGYQEGIRLGEEDARRGRSFNYERDRVYRDGTLGYESRYGSRGAYQTEFRNGFAAGYRAGYDRMSRVQSSRGWRNDGWGRRMPRGYEDPALARGYTEGYEKGLDDGRRGRSYDPVGHRVYRQGDPGYSREYGSRDVYKNSYRAGFRQGYEEGYRDGRRTRR